MNILQEICYKKHVNLNFTCTGRCTDGPPLGFGDGSLIVTSFHQGYSDDIDVRQSELTSLAPWQPSITTTNRS